MISGDLLDTQQLADFPPEAAVAYRRLSKAMLKDVNDTLSSRSDIQELIGSNHIDMMLDNHDNHVNFMATVFLLPAPSLLTKIIPWVYRAYAAHGFSYDYFPVELDAWIKTVNRHLSQDLAAPIVGVYNWMKSLHETWIELSSKVQYADPDIPEEWQGARNAFLDALLNGNHTDCLNVTSEAGRGNAIEPVFSHIMRPSMYDIGRYWESGSISVAEEHIASSIVGRCITQLYTSTERPKLDENAPSAIVTASPGEFHQLGAMMLSDCLEHDGWKVRFCGANTPGIDLIGLVESVQPDLVAISVTMPYNLVPAQHIISTIRSSSMTRNASILVGGQAFLLDKNLANIVGADAFSFELADSLKLARELVSKSS